LAPPSPSSRPALPSSSLSSRQSSARALPGISHAAQPTATSSSKESARLTRCARRPGRTNGNLAKVMPEAIAPEPQPRRSRHSRFGGTRPPMAPDWQYRPSRDLRTWPRMARTGRSGLTPLSSPEGPRASRWPAR
jgi:hypothetical protein